LHAERRHRIDGPLQRASSFVGPQTGVRAAGTNQPKKATSRRHQDGQNALKHAPDDPVLRSTLNGWTRETDAHQFEEARYDRFR
jgi:hypothetical protein